MTEIVTTGMQTTRDGRPFVNFDDWLKALPQEQQQEYYGAVARQHAYRQQAIDRGDLVILEDQSYRWRDEATMLRGKPQDPVWAQYHDRWAEENAIIGESQLKELTK